MSESVFCPLSSVLYLHMTLNIRIEDCLVNSLIGVVVAKEPIFITFLHTLKEFYC